jgi:hypothetical protein
MDELVPQTPPLTQLPVAIIARISFRKQRKFVLGDSMAESLALVCWQASQFGVGN